MTKERTARPSDATDYRARFGLCRVCEGTAALCYEVLLAPCLERVINSKFD